MTFVVMVRDECGDYWRAHGSHNLEREYTYPEVDWENELDKEAFWAWRCTITDNLQKEWEEIFGEECSVFLDKKIERIW